MPLSSRRTAGAQSRKAGEAWEEYVSARWLTPALRAGLIRRFDKLEPKKVGPYFLAAAGADYVGCRKDGTYFAVECKQTKDARFRRSEVSAVQVAHLDSVECSFLALLIDGRRFLIPWRKVPWVRLRSAESVTAGDCAIWEIRHGEWLQTLALRLQG